MFSSLILQSKKRFITAAFFYIPFFLSITLFCGCEKKEGLTEKIAFPENKIAAEKFLKHVMIEQNVLYTLIGSKPMTSFSLIPIIDEEEKREIYESKTEQIKKGIPFEKFSPTREDCRRLWEEWKRIQNRYIGKQFRIVEDKKWNEGIFINIPLVTFVFDKYYDDFSKISGEDFDTQKAYERIGSSNDKFWKKIQSSHYLLGLLLGFGEKNSRLFQLESDTNMPMSLRKGTTAYFSTGKGAHELDIEDLNIPRFVIYQPLDEQKDKYLFERKKILKIYKSKDFFELTTGFLKGEQPTEEVKELSEEKKKLIRERFWYNSRIQ